MTTSARKAYSEGHLAAIFRKNKNTNPYKEDKTLSDAWFEGHKKGMETVAFHTTALHTRQNTTWFGIN